MARGQRTKKKPSSNKRISKEKTKNDGKKRESRQNKKHEQVGGFLPGLIIGLVKAKLQKKKFNAGKYLKGAIGRRVSVAKVAAGKKVPTPGNTGMSVGDFFKSGFLGIG
jgi:hypothetical protein